MKEKVCGIYKITNKINGLGYVGQSIDCNRRWSNHKSTPLKRTIDLAIKEFGIENFTFKIEKECLPEELDYYERETIEKYHTLYPNGYNMRGGGRSGYDSVCEETRRKISENTKGEGNPMYNHKHTEEARRKISENRKGKMMGEINPSKNPEVRQKISKLKKGKPRPKYKWLTPNGKIMVMDKLNAKHHHPDWILIEEDL